MNATKFVVLLVIGVLCANVITARVAVDESKETKLGTSNPKTTTKGIGAELSVVGSTGSSSGVFTFAGASNSDSGPDSFTSGSSSTGTSGQVSATGPKADASSTSGSAANGNSEAIASGQGAAARSTGSAGSASTVRGSTSDEKKGHN